MGQITQLYKYHAMFRWGAVSGFWIGLPIGFTLGAAVIAAIVWAVA